MQEQAREPAASSTVAQGGPAAHSESPATSRPAARASSTPAAVSLDWASAIWSSSAVIPRTAPLSLASPGACAA